MGLSNPIHIAFVLVLLLLVFGAKRLPEMGRSLGSGMRGFKDSLSGEDEQHAATSAETHAHVLTPAPAPASEPLAAVAEPVTTIAHPLAAAGRPSTPAA